MDTLTVCSINKKNPVMQIYFKNNAIILRDSYGLFGIYAAYDHEMTTSLFF